MYKLLILPEEHTGFQMSFFFLLYVKMLSLQHYWKHDN